MVKTLERAFAEVSTLPEEAQEEIGRQWLTYLENFRKLKANLERAASELDAGLGEELDIEQFILEMHRRHG